MAGPRLCPRGRSAVCAQGASSSCWPAAREPSSRNRSDFCWSERHEASVRGVQGASRAWNRHQTRARVPPDEEPGRRIQGCRADSEAKVRSHPGDVSCSGRAGAASEPQQGTEGLQSSCTALPRLGPCCHTPGGTQTWLGTALPAPVTHQQWGVVHAAIRGAQISPKPSEAARSGSPGRARLLSSPPETPPGNGGGSCRSGQEEELEKGRDTRSFAAYVTEANWTFPSFGLQEQLGKLACSVPRPQSCEPAAAEPS